MASTYLTRTFGSATSRTKFTVSLWLKKTFIGAENHFFNGYNSANYRFMIYFDSSDRLKIRNVDNGSETTEYVSNAKYRDVHGWYHVVVRIDTSQAGGNRIKAYVNGEQITSWATSTEPNQGSDFSLGASSYSNILGSYAGTNHFWDGGISHYHYCDGQSYGPTEFGQTDATTGEWSIKASPSVTYGNQGFFMFDDDSSLTDKSGNGNNFTVGGGTLTKTEDCPSNVFATLNRLHMDDPASQYFLSNGNLRQNVTNNDGHRETGFTLHPKGLKGYFEVKCTVDPNFHLGLQNVTSRLLNTNYYTLASPNYYYMQSSNPVKISYANGGSSATHIADYFSQISVGDIIGCAFDFTGTNKNVWFHKNGTYGNNGSGVGNPATGAYPAMTSTQLTADEYEFIVSPNTGSGNGQLDFNFGNGYFGTTAVSSAGTNASNNGIFEYDVPTGYTALSTKGLNI